MELRYITLSGANEFTQIDKLFEFIFSNSTDLNPNYNPIEIAIQTDSSKASFGMARYWWINSLYYYAKYIPHTFNFAIHVNKDWAAKFYQGDLAKELEVFLSLRYRATCENFIGRVQINFPDTDMVVFDVKKVLAIMRNFRHIDFIFQYNEKSAEFIDELHKHTSHFSCLFDSSRGKGIVPKIWDKAPYNDVFFGFAGGLSAETIAEQFPRILASVPEGAPFWIDAESGLKDENKHFSLAKCDAYLDEIRKVATFSY